MSGGRSRLRCRLMAITVALGLSTVHSITAMYFTIKFILGPQGARLLGGDRGPDSPVEPSLIVSRLCPR